MKAFISYSHDDADLLTKFTQHLAALRRQNLIDDWTDRKIPAGGIINDHVDYHIEDAQIYLLLISAAFIDSHYCYEREFKRALERQIAGEAIIVPIIIRPCHWDISELKKFKALPDDGRPVTSAAWSNVDEAFANVVAGIRHLIESAAFPPKKPKRSPKSTFVPNENHITDEQREKLRKIGEEVVDRLTAFTATMPDEERKKKLGLYYGILWKQFGETFGITENGLKSLPAEQFNEAQTWLLQYRASKDKNFKRTNPQKYRNTLTKGIWTIARKKLGWTDDQVHAFAAEIVGYAVLVGSLNDLGNKQLETVRDRVRYAATRRDVKTKQAKARKSVLVCPELDVAKELLDLILAHPVENERGLTEILHSPVGLLEMCFIPNTTARGSASSVKKSILRPAILELLRLGWLLAPEGNDKMQIYELNPEAKR
jgi:TIR domain